MCLVPLLAVEPGEGSVQWTLTQTSLPKQAVLDTLHMCMVTFKPYKSIASPLFLQISGHRARIPLVATSHIPIPNIAYLQWPGVPVTVVDDP